ncbi:MAG: hypothetical protein ACPG4U_02585 [Pseudomonadales bacterium]
MFTTLCQLRKHCLFALFALLHIAVAAQLHQADHWQTGTVQFNHELQETDLLSDTGCDQPLLHAALPPPSQYFSAPPIGQRTSYCTNLPKHYQHANTLTLWARAPPALS